MPVTITKPSSASTPKPTSGGAPTPSFIKTGDAAKQALKEHETQAALAREQAGKPWRFYIDGKNLGKDYDITFLDGDLGPDNEIIMNSWAEHFRQIAGKWTNMVCLQPEYCPNCIADDKPNMVCAFTIIDHTPYTIQNGDKKGQTVTDQRKLYVVKPTTLAQLNKIAQAKGGLRGVRLRVTRGTARSPQVGDLFLPMDGKYTEDELAEMMGKDKDGHPLNVPFEYASAAPYYSVEELKNLGVSSTSTVIGKETGPDLTKEL